MLAMGIPMLERKRIYIQDESIAVKLLIVGTLFENI